MTATETVVRKDWRERAKARAERKLATARGIIGRCETDLRRNLSDGERRDLLTDNTSWDRELITAVVAELRAPTAA